MNQLYEQNSLQMKEEQEKGVISIMNSNAEVFFYPVTIEKMKESDDDVMNERIGGKKEVEVSS